MFSCWRRSTSSEDKQSAEAVAESCVVYIVVGEKELVSTRSTPARLVRRHLSRSTGRENVLPEVAAPSSTFSPAKYNPKPRKYLAFPAVASRLVSAVKQTFDLYWVMACACCSFFPFFSLFYIFSSAPFSLTPYFPAE